MKSEMGDKKPSIVYVAVSETGITLKLFGSKCEWTEFSNSVANCGSYEMQFNEEKYRKEYIIRRALLGVKLDSVLANELSNTLPGRSG